MQERGEFRVSVAKDYLVFASAHFITFAGHRCEGLHGHNYRAAVTVEGALNKESWFVFDFVELKRIMKRLCDEIDHLVLLPLQSDRVGVLLPNSTAIPLSYYSTQKIGAVTVILDARLKGKELQGVLKDADLKLLIVHNQLYPEVEEIFRDTPAIPVWVVNGEGDRGFEKRFSAPAGALSLAVLWDSNALRRVVSETGRAAPG